MAFRIIREDITRVSADAIVNTADPEPVIGLGTDAAVHRAAGDELIKARRKIGYIAPGCTAVTPGYGLDAKYVFHTVSPVWTGGSMGERELLRKAYDVALGKALELGCSSIAFPLMAAGNLGFPKEIALKTAVDSFSDFLMENDMDITLAVFDESVFRLSEKLLTSVESFIDEKYMDAAIRREYSSREIMELNDSLSEDPVWLEFELLRRGAIGSDGERKAFGRMLDERPLLKAVLDSKIETEGPVHHSCILEDGDGGALSEERERSLEGKADEEARKLSSLIRREQLGSPVEMFPVMQSPVKELKSLLGDSGTRHIGAHKSHGRPYSDLKVEPDEGFSDALRRLINESGEKPSAVYKRANIDRKLYSKIMSNGDYQPSKPTAIAFAIALRLDLEQTSKLLRRAGYALTHSSVFDIIIEYAITHGIWNVIEINTILFSYDQTLLGSGMDRA